MRCECLLRRCLPHHRIFTKFTYQKAALYGFAWLYVCVTVVVVLVEPFVNPPCDETIEGARDFGNPAYKDYICLNQHYVMLMGLTKEECEFGRRILVSIILGSLVGWERREKDRPAGIRTMALVSMGSCVFTITSAHAFIHGPMTWDASRVAAAIPSGVGFLGAGLIWKQAAEDDDGEPTQVIHGLTTAASLWLSAALGIACGGGMYFLSTFCVSTMLILLRFGPRQEDEPEQDEHEDLKKYDEEQGPQNYGANGFFTGRDYDGALQDEKEPISSTQRGRPHPIRTTHYPSNPDDRQPLTPTSRSLNRSASRSSTHRLLALDV